MDGQATIGQREAANFLAAHAQLTDFIRGCSDEAWATIVPIEQRTVAVMSDHMAVGYELVVGWIETAQEGMAILGTQAQQDAENARYASERAGVSREEVLARVEEAAPRVAAALAAVPQELADTDVRFGPAEGPVQVGRLMSMAAIHVTRHLGHVRKALDPSPIDR